MDRLTRYALAWSGVTAVFCAVVVGVLAAYQGDGHIAMIAAGIACLGITLVATAQIKS